MSYNRSLICENCGREFKQTRKEQRFCSRKCGKESISARAKVSPFHNLDKGEWRTCCVCGATYWSRNSRPKKTCSRKCSYVLKRGELNVKYKPKIEVSCKQCGKKILVWPSIKDRKHFCSDACKYKWRSENIRGDKVHNWMGGVCFGKYCEKFNFKFKERVRIFFKRKCFVCGCDEIVERHHVHHINFNPKACCDSSEREFIILCRSCHANTTNSLDRNETARWYSMQLHKLTGGKCYYTKEEMKSLNYEVEDLQNKNRWALAHLML